MLAGEGVTAIWNDVVPEAQEDFLGWHMREHMAERVGLPGFRRGRRHVALDAGTRPAFFTLYEADSLQVLQGHDYTNRLNGMTPWTRRVMAGLRGTARALAQVVESRGPGLGGVMMTLRFEVPESAQSGASASLAKAVRDVAEQPGIAGAHLCRTDAASSAAGNEERQARQGDGSPPGWFLLVEAAGAEALAGKLPDAELAAAGAVGPVTRGIYRLEFLLAKTAGDT